MPERSSKRRNPHAVALGRRGGVIGGAARARRLSAKRRSEIASAAARARWGERRTGGKGPARERILNAARAEFLARGFEGARVDRIAARANVNRRTVYDHFGSKDGMFREMLRLSVVRISHLAASSAAATLGEGLVAWRNAVHAYPQWARLSMWEALSDPVHPVAAVERRRFWNTAVTQLARAQAAGALPIADAGMLQLMLIGVVMFPMLLPQMASFVTGADPSSIEFQQREEQFLRALGSWIEGATRETPGPTA